MIDKRIHFFFTCLKISSRLEHEDTDWLQKNRLRDYVLKLQKTLIDITSKYIATSEISIIA